MLDKTLPNEILALTQAEIDVLGRMLDSGDRGAFHYSYYRMSGTTDALLTAKVSTFSETIGGTAYAANWLLSEMYGQDGFSEDPNASSYLGIYYLSQQVALRILANSIIDRAQNGSGFLDDQEHFQSATEAWTDANNPEQFPGRYPDGLDPFFDGGTNASVIDVLFQINPEPGEEASRFGIYYADATGKRLSDFEGVSGYITIESSDAKIVTDSSGRVAGVFNNIPMQDDVNAVLANTASQAVNFFTTTAEARETFMSGLISGNLAERVEKDSDASEIIEARRGFSEFSGTYNGDPDPELAFTYTDPGIIFRGAATTGDDILTTSSGGGAIAAGDGNDLIFGAPGVYVMGALVAGNDSIDGEDDDDIIWSFGGSDTIDGGEGNDVIRAGDGNDVVKSSIGNDTLSGGGEEDAMGDRLDYSNMSSSVKIGLAAAANEDANAIFSIKPELSNDEWIDIFTGFENILLSDETVGSVGKLDMLSSAALDALNSEGIVITAKIGSALDFGQGQYEGGVLAELEYDGGVSVDLASGTATISDGPSGAEFIGFDHVYGSNRDDTLLGNDGWSGLFGGAGNDLIEGVGNLDGGSGNDIIRAGSGSEVSGGPVYVDGALGIVRAHPDRDVIYAEGQISIGGAPEDVLIYEGVDISNASIGFFIHGYDRDFNPDSQWQDLDAMIVLRPSLLQFPLPDLSQQDITLSDIRFDAFVHVNPTLDDFEADGKVKTHSSDIQISAFYNGHFGIDMSAGLTSSSGFSTWTFTYDGQDYSYNAGVIEAGTAQGGVNDFVATEATGDGSTLTGGDFDLISYATAVAAADIDTDLGVAGVAGVGSDTLIDVSNAAGSAYDDLISGGSTDDFFLGGAGNDTLSGKDGSDILHGDDGDDVLKGGKWADRLDGGTGFDTADYSDSPEAVVASLADPSVNTGEAFGDTYKSIEAVSGSVFADTVEGDQTANLLSGAEGNDSLSGGSGNDTLDGGAGSDTLIGGAGYDRLDFSAGDGSDVVLGFQRNFDILAIDGVTALADVTITSSGSDAVIGYGSGDQITLVGIDAAEVDEVTFGLAGIPVFGTSGADTLTGGPGVDIIDGLGGSDRIDGGDSADVLRGGSGNDTISGGADADTLDGGSGVDVALFNLSPVGVSIDLTLDSGTGGEAEGDVLTSIEQVLTSDYADTLKGGAEQTVLYGGDGDDLFLGAAGNDVFSGDGGSDVLSYETASAAVTVNTSALSVFTDERTGSQFGAYHAEITGLGKDHFFTVEEFRGSLFDDTMIGGDGAPTNSNGADVFYGLAGHDSITGDAGNDLLDGGADDDTLDGGAGNDTLIGGSGDDSLIGSFGTDSLEGGAGFDQLDYSSLTGGIGIDLTLSQAILSDGATQTFSGIEAITGSAGEDSIIGSTSADVLSASSGNDTLTGGAGNDTLNGGAGYDVYVFAPGDGTDVIEDFEIDIDVLDIAGVTALSNVTITASGSDTIIGYGSGDQITLVGIDSALIHEGVFGLGILPIIGTNGADTLTGGAGPDVIDGLGGDDRVDGLLGNDDLRGGSGNDTLAGGAGADTLTGGAGTDYVDYASDNAGVVVDLAAGTATDGTGSVDILVGVERVFGSAYGDNITGDGTNNRIEAGAGADTVDGGAGFDFIGFAGATEAVVVDLDAGVGLAGLAAGDQISNIQGIGSTPYDDTFTGGSGQTIAFGGDGNDLFLGKTGGDIYVGEGGTDTVSFENATGAVTLHTDGYAPVVYQYNGGTVNAFYADIAGVGRDFFVSTESYIGSDFTDRFYGGAAGETFNGGSGNDSLWGYSGNDTILGGSGNDGIDGGNGYDSLVGGDGDDLIYGGSHVDTLFGGSGNDVLYGGSWDDGLTGQEGDDTLYGDPGNDLIYGGSGNDNLYGGSENDTLEGHEGNDYLDGEAGNDVHLGGEGDDTIRGSAGSDRFEGGSGIDTLDFSYSSGIVTLDFAGGLLTFSPNGSTEVMTGFENAIGSNGATTFLGTADANVFTGLGAADRLEGAGGDDTLTGGGGADVFAFSGAHGDDVIEDFAEAVDVIDLASFDPLTVTFTIEGSDTRIQHSTGSILVQNVTWASAPTDGSLVTDVPLQTPNLAPTAVTLTNTLASLDESADTSSRIKIADIVVTDDGLGNNSLALSGTDAAKFEIDGAELYLSAGAVLDFEAQTSLSITVEVDDVSVGVTPDASAGLSLTINDINEAPAAIALTNLVTNLDETVDTTARIKIADIAITDDALGTNALSLTGADAAAFEIDGAELYLSAGTALDHETQAGLALAVEVDDTAVGSTPDASAAHILAINDVNEAPVLIELTNLVASLDETADTTARIKIADIAITDDALGSNTLSLTGADAAAFEIDGTELYLSAGAVLDHEIQASLALTVEVDDTAVGSTPDASAAHTLAVADINEAPTAVALSNLNIMENQAGAVIGTITVSDPDVGDSHGLTVDDVRFEIVGSTLQLKAGEALDYETEATVSLTITATDQGALFHAAPVILMVGDQIASSGSYDVLLSGTSSADTLDGTIGDDEIKGLQKNDVLNGYEGNDLLNGAGGKDTLTGGSGNDGIKAGGGADVASGNEGDDTLEGQNGTDTLSGGAGDDSLNGGGKADRLTGDVGADTLTGGADADTFVFAAGAGADQITDFELGVDTIEITGGLAYGDLTITDVGSDAEIAYGTGDTILALGLAAADLTASEFTFLA